MYTFLLIIHIFVCLFLIAVILLQAGKGGGMAETLGGSITQSILGTRSTAFMTRLTAICATLFLLTCLSLTYLSAQRRASLFQRYRPLTQSVPPTPAPAPQAATPVSAPTSEPTLDTQASTPATATVPSSTAPDSANKN